MKTTIIIVLTLLSVSIHAQISEGGMPFSYATTPLKSQKALPEIKLGKLDKKKLKEEDAQHPTPLRYSTFEEVNVDMKSGVSTPINDPPGTIWRYAFSSDSCFSIQLIFKRFKIPSGAKLFLYNDDYSIVYGAFTSENKNSDNSFTVADFPGQKLIVEYFEPLDAEFKGEVVVGSIGQSYRNITEKSLEENTYIDINCEEGKNWQGEKHSVCKITFRVGDAGYLCTGALINNTENDGTPYFLTANHCIADSSVAKTLVAYFNYEKKSCNGATNQPGTLTGSRLLSTGTKSDYTLLRLNNTPPASYMPFYAGWDISNYNDNLNTSIHHPEGIEKKISVDYDRIITYDYAITWDEGGSTPPSSHWMVVFDKGITNQGSSGGPIFSKQKRIIGQLHGGDGDGEFYGKLNYSWNNNAAGSSPLRVFLDPRNTGTQILNSYYPVSNPPDAFFTPSFTDVCINSPLTLNDNSAFAPTSRTWTISPATYSFVNGTNQTSPNPQVRFNSAGSYTVKLKVANGRGTDSLQLNNVITAANDINVNWDSNLGNSVCYYNFDSIVLTGYGAETFIWSLEQPSLPFYFSRVNGDTAVLTKSKIAIDSTFILNVNITGTMGTCTASAQRSIEFVKVLNDDIANAIEIKPGRSKTFSNFCATLQTNEPVPPADSCTGLKSWCDEYGNGQNLVENSVWFKFIGPSTGTASLVSSGFDNQIAIYEANSYQEILNGNYTLIAANDDESDTNPNPSIPGINVKAGKMYWVQVDGSGGGNEGSFTLTLSDKTITGVPAINDDNSVTLYPIPATNTLTLQSSSFENKELEINIYNLSGQVFMEKKIMKPAEKEISMNIENLLPGVYFIKIVLENKTTIKKFIKN